MSGFIEGISRGQPMLFPDRLEDWIDEDHLVRVVDFFVDELDLTELGFVAPLMPAQVVLAIILPFCSSCLSTVI